MQTNEARARDPLSEIGLVVGLVLLGLAFAPLLQLPEQTVSASILGSSVEVELSGSWLLGAILALIAASGTAAILGSHPVTRTRGLADAAASSALPGLIALAAAFLVSPSLARPFWLGGLAVTGLTLAIAIVVAYRALDSNGIAKLALNLLSYTVALIFFAAIYGTRVRSLLSATAVLGVAALVASVVLRNEGCSAARAWRYVVVTALIIGEVAWVLNYWTMSGLTGGLLLLIVFYLTTGLAQQAMSDRLDRRALVEFALVGLTLAAAILWIRPG
jgi:hypothetical protein